MLRVYESVCVLAVTWFSGPEPAQPFGIRPGSTITGARRYGQAPSMRSAEREAYPLEVVVRVTEPFPGMHPVSRLP